MPEPRPDAVESAKERVPLWTLARLAYAGFSLASIITGISYMPFTAGPAELPSALQILTTTVWLWVWASVWVVAGLAGILAAVMDLRPPWLAIGTSLQVGISFVWAASYTLAWVLNDWDRSYVTAATYWGRLLPILAVGVLARLYRPEIRDDQ